MSGQRSRQGTRTAGLKARTQLSQMSASREQRLREEGRWQPGSTFASGGNGLARTTFARTANQGKYPGPPGSDLRVTEVAQPGQTSRRRETGFSRSVKLAVRKRAGNGDIEQAACECCGVWLGRYGGQVHHRLNRGMGGSKLRNGIQNAALLCGTPDDLDTCHGKATRAPVSSRMYAMGFCLKDGQDPTAEPLMLHGEQGGVLVRLTPDGAYEPARPGEVS